MNGADRIKLVHAPDCLGGPSIDKWLATLQDLFGERRLRRVSHVEHFTRYLPYAGDHGIDLPPRCNGLRVFVSAF